MRSRRAHVTGSALALVSGVCLHALVALEISAAPDLARADPQAAEATPRTEDPAGLERRAGKLEAAAFSLEDPDEARALLLEAAALHERRAARIEGPSNARWRAARATWMAGESLPLDDHDRRIAAFERARDLADEGLRADPNCAGCMIWKAIALGRLRTTTAVWSGLVDVREMADLLERAIALNPTYRDGDRNSLLGNAHYTSAIFYRLVPDWFWLRWVIGVKGDKERALEHSRQALALHPTRFDYQIEVGAQLLCLGDSRDDPARTAEGIAFLKGVLKQPIHSVDEAREARFARILIDEPQRACGYSGDKFLEIEEEVARRQVSD